LEKFKRKKKSNIFNFLVILFCTFIIISTIGNTVRLANSFTQREQPATQSPSTMSMTATQPPLNNRQNKVPTTTQPQNNTQNTTQAVNATPSNNELTHHLALDQFRSFNLVHKFANGPELAPVVVGSDRFRFVKSFWTSSDVSTNTNPDDNPCPTGATTPTPTSAASVPAPNPTIITASSDLSTSNLNIEVDRDEGYATLVIMLQYEGVVPLEGISAALRLPSGFAAQLPLETDRNDYSIALSNIAAKPIVPGDSVALCFPLNILPNAVVQLPVLGPLALHFLRYDQRLIQDGIFTSARTAGDRELISGIPGEGARNNTLLRDRFNTLPAPPSINEAVFNRVIRGDYINQLIPAIWKVTGREILDVSLPPASPGAAISLECPLPAVVKLAYSPCVIPVAVVFSNLGDVGIHNLVATFAANFTSVRGPAVTTTAYPLGIVNHAVYHLFSVPAGSSFTRTLYIRTTLPCSAVQPLSVSSTYTDAIGQRVTQVNTVTLQIQRAGNITSGQCQEAAAGQQPGVGSNGPSQGQGGGAVGSTSNSSIIPGPPGQGGGAVGPGSTSNTSIVPGPPGQGGGAVGPGPTISTTIVPQGALGRGLTNSTTIIPRHEGQGTGAQGPVSVKSITVVPRPQGLPEGALRLGPVKSITVVPRPPGQGTGAQGPGPTNSTTTTVVPRH
jgi:hypothetical protein